MAHRSALGLYEGVKGAMASRLKSRNPLIHRSSISLLQPSSHHYQKSLVHVQGPYCPVTLAHAVDDLKVDDLIISM